VKAWGRALQQRWRGLGGIARDFAIVGGSTAIGQGAILVAAPLLARLYDPRDFGILAVFAAVLSILVAIASFRVDLAVPIAADRVEALHLVVVSNVIALAASIALAVVLLLWGGQLAVALGGQALVSFLWLLPIALFLASFIQTLASWAVYNRTFSQLGRMRVVQGVTQAGGQVTLGLLHVGPIGLILGDVVSRFAGAGQLTRSLLADLRSTLISRSQAVAYARARSGFARIMTGASFLTALSLQAPFLIIPAFFDLASSGQYFLALRVLALPASLVVAAVGQVFFGEASHRRIEPQRLHDLTHDAAASLLVFSIPTYGIVLVAGQALIVLVFGQEWQLAGLYAQIMAPSLIFWTVANPMSSLPLVGRRERESLLFTVAELALKVLALGIGAALHSLTLGIVVLSITSVIIEAAAMWRFLRVASVSLRGLARPVSRTVLSTLPFLLLLLLVAQAVPVALPVAAAIAWIGAFGLSVRNSKEARALMSKSYG
jgi:O-antigen/teichoic acid export membrane protein